MEVLELHEKFIGELLKCIDDKWEKVELKFEYFPWKGSNFEKYDSRYFHKSLSRQFDPSLEALDVLIEMIQKMSEGGKEKWTWCVFSLDRSGKYDFDFQYGMPPMVEEMLRSASEIG